MSEQSELEHQLETNLAQLSEAKFVDRLWQRDGTLFAQPGDEQGTARAVRNRLGWLFSLPAVRDQVEALAVFARVVERHRFDRVVVVGMGGSSLWPEVVGRHLRGKRGLPVIVADSIHPVAIAELVDQCRAGKPLFVISSKSGTTIETMSLYRHLRGIWPSGDQFVAITDVGSALHQLARTENFREIFTTPTDVGGRYAATTLIGVVPAVLTGVVLQDALQRAQEMLDACREPDPRLNTGALLGAWLAAGVQTGRDRVVLALSKDLRAFGSWLEQLIAESSGKNGMGLMPLTGAVAGTGTALADRLRHCLVVGIGTFAHPDDDFLDRSRDAAVPEHSDVLPEVADLWGETVRWQFAMTVCGYLLGVNPFDEPDVAVTKELTQAILRGERQPAEFYASIRVTSLAALPAAVPAEFLQSGENCALTVLAWLAPNSANSQRLDALRVNLTAKINAPVAVQVGSRYLHATGQLHKGGRQGHKYLIVVDTTAANDLQQPEMPAAFAQLLRAQALADACVLVERGNSVVWADLAPASKAA